MYGGYFSKREDQGVQCNIRGSGLSDNVMEEARRPGFPALQVDETRMDILRA